MRSLNAALAGAATAALGALIAGEYELVGAGALVAAAAFGFVVAEVMGAVDRTPPVWLAAAAAGFTAAGLWWARAEMWQTGANLGHAIPTEVTAGVVVGAIVAAAALSRRRRPRTPETG